MRLIRFIGLVLRVVTRLVLSLVFIVLLLVLAVFGALQIPALQNKIGPQLSALLSGPEAEYRIEGLSGFIPFDMRLDHVALADPQGVWFSLDEARVAWRPRALLRGRVVVEEIAAERVALNRLPPGGATPEEEIPPSEPGVFQLPDLPDSLPGFALERLYVGEIALGEPVIGEAATFRLSGQAGVDEPGERVTVDLDLRRTDQPRADLVLDAALDLPQETLNLQLSASETGGLIGKLAGLPAAGDAEFSLNGAGPLRDWQGDLRLVAEELLRADGTISLALDETLGVGLDLRAVPQAGLLPGQAATLAGQPLEVILRAAQTAPQAFAFDEVAVTGLGLDFAANGRVDLASRTLDVSTTLNAEALERYSDLAGLPLGGSVDLALEADGPFTFPRAQLALTARNLTAATFNAETISLNLDAPEAAQAGAVVPVMLQARIETPRLTDGPELPFATATLDGRAQVQADGPLTLETLSLQARPLNLVAEGLFDPTTQAGQLTLNAEAGDLAALQSLSGLPELAGALRLTVDAEAQPGLAPIIANLEVRSENLAGLPPQATPLVGPAPSLRAAVEATPGELVEVRDLQLEAQGVTAQGEATFNQADNRVVADLTATIADLAAASDAAGQPLAGAGDIALHAEGALDDFAATLRADIADLAVNATTLSALNLNAEAQGLPQNPNGRLSLRAVKDEQDLQLDAAGGLNRREVEVSELRLTAPQTELTGQASGNLDTLLFNGQVNGEARDLSALTPLIGLPLNGAVSLDLDLAHDEGQQNAELAARVNGLSGPIDNLQSLRLDARARDVFGALDLDAEAVLDGLQAGSASVQRATLTAQGSQSQLDITAEIDGAIPEPIRVDLASRVDLNTPIIVDLNRLNGELYGEALRLTGPARVVYAQPSIEVSGLDLRWGQAALTADAVYGPERLDGTIALTDLALAALEQFGVVDFSGSAVATVNLAGTPAAPRISLNAGLRDLTPTGLDLARTPSADIDLSGEVAGGQAQARLDVTELFAEPLTARAAVPLSLSLEPFAFDLPQDGSLDGGLTGNIDLRRVAGIVGLEGQTLAGNVNADLSVGGTLQSPAVGGDLRLTDGEYENTETGTLLTDMTLVIEGRGQALQISELRATDGADGRVSGEGGASFDPAGGTFDFNAALNLARMTVVDMPIANAILSGDIAASGDSAGAAVNGDILIEEVNVDVGAAGGGGGGPDVTEIEVVEAGDAEQELANAGEDDSYPINLAINITAPNQIFVRGRGVDSEWIADLDVNGTASAPEVIGRVEVRRGELDALDRTFDLRTGIIDFDGAQPPIPTLNVEAAAEAGDIIAIIRVSGPATDPELAFTSEPELPEDEVLAKLLFDRDLSEITPVQATKLAFALNELRGGGGGGFDPLGSLRSGLGLDNLEIGGDLESGPSVKAGRYLSDNVYLEVERGAGEGSGKARVEVEITPNITLDTEVDENSQSGVQLQWKYDY